MLRTSAVNMHGHVTVQPEHAGIGRCDIDAPLAVLADATNHSEFISTLEIALDFLSVIAQQSLTLGYQPEVPITVLHHPVNRLDIRQQSAQLAGLPFLYSHFPRAGLFRRHAQHAMCRGAHQNVTIATL